MFKQISNSKSSIDVEIFILACRYRTHAGVTTAPAIVFQQFIPLFYHRQVNRAFEIFQSIIEYCLINIIHSTVRCLWAVFEECIA